MKKQIKIMQKATSLVLCGLLCPAAMLGSCAQKTEQEQTDFAYSGTRIVGQVTKIEDKTVTLTLGELTENAAPGDNPGKFQDILKRRLERGQCYSMPYLGTREFPAHFRRCEVIPPCPEELRGERDLGWMLLDMDYSDPENIVPRFFRATLKDGVMDVPAWESEGVKA